MSILNIQASHLPIVQHRSPYEAKSDEELHAIKYGLETEKATRKCNECRQLAIGFAWTCAGLVSTTVMGSFVEEDVLRESQEQCTIYNSTPFIVCNDIIACGLAGYLFMQWF